MFVRLLNCDNLPYVVQANTTHMNFAEGTTVMWPTITSDHFAQSERMLVQEQKMSMPLRFPNSNCFNPTPVQLFMVLYQHN